MGSAGGIDNLNLATYDGAMGGFPRSNTGGGGSGDGGTTIVVTPTTTFIFRGFYVAGAVYEAWTGTSRNTPPTSGHTLQDITVTGELPRNSIF